MQYEKTRSLKVTTGRFETENEGSTKFKCPFATRDGNQRISGTR